MRLPTLLLILSTAVAPMAILAAPDHANSLLHRDADGRGDRELLGPTGPRSTTSLDQAVRQIRQETGGRILAAETLNVGGVRVHRIKVLTPENRVRIIRVDAKR